MAFKWRMAIAAVIVVGISIFGWSHFHNPKPSQYQIAAITIGDVNASVAATGTCNAVVTVQVGSQVSGNIKALFVDFNTKVKKGELVALIDPELFQARVRQSQASLDNARAAVMNAKAAAARAQAEIASAEAARENVKAQLLRSQADLRDAEIKLRRRQALFEKGLLSMDDADTAQASYDAAAASVRAAEAQVKAADQNVQAAVAQSDVARAQIESTSAQVRQAEAALSQAELDLRHTEIRAPVDGTVIARNMDVGQTVAASFQAPTILAIAQDLTRMYVDTNVDESDISQVQVGQHASFTVDAYPDFTFPAVVSQIRKAPINVQNVITYDVVLSVDNTDLRLLPGMTANVRILTNAITNTLRVPNAALRFRPAGNAQNNARKEKGKQTIYILAAGGKPQAVQVTTSLGDGSFTAISSSELHAGDPVIIASAASPPAAAARPQGPRGPGF